MTTSDLFIVILIVIVFIVIPGLISLAGVWIAVRNLRFRRRAMRLQGTVEKVETITIRGSENGPRVAYMPTFTFTAPNGETLSLNPDVYGARLDFPVGSKQPILVDFDDPPVVQMPGNGRLFTAVGMIVFGAAPAITGVIVLLVK